MQQDGRGDHQHAAGLGRESGQRLVKQDARVALSDPAGLELLVVGVWAKPPHLHRFSGSTLRAPGYPAATAPSHVPHINHAPQAASNPPGPATVPLPTLRLLSRLAVQAPPRAEVGLPETNKPEPQRDRRSAFRSDHHPRPAHWSASPPWPSASRTLPAKPCSRRRGRLGVARSRSAPRESRPGAARPQGPRPRAGRPRGSRPSPQPLPHHGASVCGMPYELDAGSSQCAGPVSCFGSTQCSGGSILASTPACSLSR